MANNAVLKINTAANPAYADASTASSAATYANFSSLPDANQNQGVFAITTSEGELWVANGGTWYPICRVS